MGEVEGSDWGVGGGGKEFVDWLLWFVDGLVVCLLAML